MIQLLQTVLSLVVTLGILVTVHEFGHFWVARRCGVKVLRFSVGFGKPFFSRYDRHGTEFAVAAIPLGGYVKMLDEREGPVPEELRAQAFTSKTPGQRIAIAGEKKHSATKPLPPNHRGSVLPLPPPAPPPTSFLRWPPTGC